MSVDVPEQVDYQKTSSFEPIYDYVPIYPNENTTAISTVSAGQERNFIIPSAGSDCVNLAKSYLTLKLTPTAGGVGPGPADYYNWIFTNVMPFTTVQIFTSGGVYLMDWSNVQAASKCLMDAAIDNETVDNCILDPTAAAAFCDVPTRNGGGYNIIDGTPYQMDLTVPREAIVGGADVANPVLTLRIPFTSFVHSIASLDKDLWFPETIRLRIVFPKFDNFGFRSTSATVPTTNPTTLLTDVSISNIQLYCAVERNPVLSESVIASARSNGMELLYDNCNIGVQSFTNAGATANPPQSLFDNSFGKYLKRVYIAAVVQATGQLQFACPATTFTSYYSLLDTRQLQQQQLTVGTITPYSWIKPLIKGTWAMTSQYWSKNWFHVDGFDSMGAVESSNSQKECGIELSQQKRYQFYANVSGAATVNYYTIAVFQRKLIISGNRVLYVNSW